MESQNGPSLDSLLLAHAILYNLDGYPREIVDFGSPIKHYRQMSFEEYLRIILIDIIIS